MEQQPASIALSHDGSVLTAPGGDLQLQADVADANGNPMSEDLIWESSDPAVARVDADGLVTTRRGGVVVITAIARDQDRGVSATVELTVQFRPLTVTGDPNERDSRNGRTLLHVAAMANATDMIRALAAAGADIEARDYYSRTPVHLATRGNAPEAIALLLELGADLDVLDRYGQTPLQYAASLWAVTLSPAERVRSMAPDAAAALLAAGADPNRHNSQSRCYAPLHWAVRGAQRLVSPLKALPTVLALLEGGADPDLPTCDSIMYTPLILATVFSDDLAVVTALLEAGADVGKPDVLGRTPLDYWAFGTPLTWMFRSDSYMAIHAELLAAGADVNVRANNGWTPLHRAAATDNVMAIRALLEAGADPAVRDTRGSTPLHAAAQGASPAAMAVLLDAGSDPQALNHDGRTALEVAYSGIVPVIEVLFEARAGLVVDDPDARDTFDYTALHAAARANNPTLIAALLAAGAELDARDKDYDHTPLLMASGVTRDFDLRATVSPAAIRALLAAGADPEAVDRDGRTALQHALEWGHTAAIAALAEAAENREGSAQRDFMAVLALAAGDPEALPTLVADGTNPDARDAEGYTVLHRVMAWENSRALAALEVLAESRADLNAPRSDSFDTPMHLAAIQHRPNLVAALLEAGADPAGGPSGWSVLHAAVDGTFENRDTVTLLLAAGADPESVYHALDRTPLHIAAESGNPRAIAALLAAGADPNAQDANGQTALHLAATPRVVPDVTTFNVDRYAAAVATLLEARADIDVTDNSGNTPLDLAMMAGEEASAALLRAFSP